MILLGLDISTSITAYSLIDTEQPQRNCIIKFDGIHLSKEKSIYDKADLVKNHLLNVKKEFNVDIVYVEESLQAFRRGLSSAKTLSTLARFNGVVCYLAEDIFKCPVNLINVIHARSNLGIKLNRKSKVNVKDQVLEWVKQHETAHHISWPTKTMKSGPRKGMIIDDKSCYDIADSIVMSLYGLKNI